MSVPTLLIDDQAADLGTVWANWKMRAGKPQSRFRLLVPGEFVEEVFDPHRHKRDCEPWDHYILSQLREFRSAAFQAYIRRLMSLSGLNDGTKEWVLTLVHAVKPTDQGLLLEGPAEPFDIRQTPRLTALR